MSDAGQRANYGLADFPCTQSAQGEAQTHHARITREIIDSALAFQTGVESFGCLLNQTIKRTGVETAVAESKDDLLFNIQRMRTIIKEFVDESQNLVDSLPHVA